MIPERRWLKAFEPRAALPQGSAEHARRSWRAWSGGPADVARTFLLGGRAATPNPERLPTHLADHYRAQKKLLGSSDVKRVQGDVDAQDILYCSHYCGSSRRDDGR